jgi:hypothetical protein
MSRTPESTNRPAALPLADLFTRYLSRQADAQALGLGHAEPIGDVEPYEAVPVQPVEPGLAWSDAIAAAKVAGAPATAWPVPPEWPALVAMQEPAVAVPFCMGNFPQLVRDLQPLIDGVDPVTTREPGRPLPLSGLTAWAEQQKSYPMALWAAGVLRLARQFDAAEAALCRAENVPAAWRAMHANEMAALAWHRGRYSEALGLWQAQPASVPVLFNRGMALLFLGQPAEAREALLQAVAGLTETNAWYHLGQLYVTLANAKG